MIGNLSLVGAAYLNTIEYRRVSYCQYAAMHTGRVNYEVAR